MPLIYDRWWQETFAVYSPERGLIYFNINGDPEVVGKKEKVSLIPIEEATELFYKQAEEVYELQRDTIEITGYELVYARYIQQMPEYKNFISPYWKITFQPKTLIKDWMPFFEKYGLLKEEYRGSDAYLLVEAFGGDYMEAEEEQ